MLHWCFLIQLHSCVERSVEAGIDKDLTKWLVSILSVGSMLGRFLAGFVSFFPRIDPSKLVAITTMMGAVISFVAAFWLVDNAAVQVTYAVTWGLCIGEKIHVFHFDIFTTYP